MSASPSTGGWHVSFSSPRPGQWRVFVLFLAAAAVLSSARSAVAQMTVENLIGTAVSSKGPHIIDIKQAIEKFQARDFDEAKKLLLEARKKTPKLAPAEIMMAQLYFAGSLVPQGRAELEIAVKNNPQDPEAFVMIAELATAEGRFTESRLVFTKASELAKAFKDNPKRKLALQVRAYTGLTTLDEGQDQWSSARAIVSEWIKMDPEDATPHQRMGRILFHLEQYDEAYKELQTAAKADEKAMPAEVAMANLYQGKRDPVKTREWLNKALQSGGKDLATLIAVAQLKFSTNEFDEATKYVEAAAKADPKSLDAKVLRGIIARMQRDYPTAKQQLESAHIQSPSNPAVMNHLALVLLEMSGDGNQRRAVEFAEINYRANPTNFEAAGTLGWVYYRVGRVGEAQSFLAQATKNGIRALDMAYYMASIYASQARASEATAILDAALQQHDQMFFYRTEAEALFQKLKKDKKAPAAGSAVGNEATAEASDEQEPKKPAATTKQTAKPSAGSKDSATPKKPAATAKKPAAERPTETPAEKQ